MNASDPQMDTEGPAAEAASPAPAGRWGRTPHPVFWAIAGALIVIAGVMVARPGSLPWPAAAMGQTSGGLGARGVFAFSGQLSKGTSGVFIVDTDTMTICAYEYLDQKDCLRLAACRTWRYDRYLENYNVCDLPPDAVEQMVDEQRQVRQQRIENEMP